ncbi:MAG: hypothetical protein Q4B70_00740 [Lachnospiraceae bacterium]|nr:hypothetical protein [Lachnospiraceae bacterium]
MFDLLYDFLSNVTALEVGSWITVAVSILFIVMIVRKRNRDERGWKILGKASIIAFIFMMVLINAMAKIIGVRGYDVDMGMIQWGNTITWIYNTVIMVEIASIWIIRKIE